MEAGHFSASGIYDHLRDVALKYAFLMYALSACPAGASDSARLRDDAFIAVVSLGAVVALAGMSFGKCRTCVRCEACACALCFAGRHGSCSPQKGL